MSLDERRRVEVVEKILEGEKPHAVNALREWVLQLDEDDKRVVISCAESGKSFPDGLVFPASHPFYQSYVSTALQGLFKKYDVSISKEECLECSGGRDFIDGGFIIPEKALESAAFINGIKDFKRELNEIVPPTKAVVEQVEKNYEQQRYVKSLFAEAFKFHGDNIYHRDISVEYIHEGDPKKASFRVRANAATIDPRFIVTDVMLAMPKLAETGNYPLDMKKGDLESLKAGVSEFQRGITAKSMLNCVINVPLRLVESLQKVSKDPSELKSKLVGIAIEIATNTQGAFSSKSKGGN